MISNLHVKTIVGAESAYACINFGHVIIDVRLQGGRSAAESLRQWSMEELQKADRHTHRAMLAISAAKALDAAGFGETHAVEPDASVESAAEMIERLAGFISTYTSTSAMDAGGCALVDRARSMAKLMRGEPMESPLKPAYA